MFENVKRNLMLVTIVKRGQTHALREQSLSEEGGIISLLFKQSKAKNRYNSVRKLQKVLTF